MRCARQVLAVAFSLLLFSLHEARAQEANAQQAAEGILSSLADQEFRGVWDKKVSEWARKNWSQDGFLASMAMGRPVLGALRSVQVISREHATKDPSTGAEGDIYSITFRTKY